MRRRDLSERAATAVCPARRTDPRCAGSGAGLAAPVARDDGTDSVRAVLHVASHRARSAVSQRREPPADIRRPAGSNPALWVDDPGQVSSPPLTRLGRSSQNVVRAGAGRERRDRVAPRGGPRDARRQPGPQNPFEDEHCPRGVSTPEIGWREAVREPAAAQRGEHCRRARDDGVGVVCIEHDEVSERPDKRAVEC
jgi:hypothetical protein